MSENNKSSEVVMAEAYANLTNPVLEKVAQSVNTLANSIAEVKSVKEDYEAKSKQEEVEKKSILERLDAAEKKSAILEAELAEVKAKKTPAYVGGATQVESLESLQYEVKSKAIKSLTNNIDASEREVMYKQGVAYLESFCKKHNDVAQRYDLSTMLGELSTKGISHTITDMNALFNAPFILPAIVYAEKEMVMQRVATVYASNSRTVARNSFVGEGEPEWIGLQTKVDPQKATVYTIKQINAAGLARYVTLSDTVQDAASLSMPQIMSILQSFMKEQIMTKFEKAYSGTGITIGDVGGTIEGIVPATVNQYAYDFTSTAGSDQLVVGKLAFVKSGHATEFTYNTAIKMKGTLPEQTRLQFMANSTMIDKFKNLKDPTTQSIIYYNGNGAAIVNGLPDKQLGFELIVNNKMADNVAVYGDITGSYGITNCFGGYKVFDRPAVGGELFDGLLGKMYSTGMITNYKTIRLYKIEQ